MTNLFFSLITDFIFILIFDNNNKVIDSIHELNINLHSDNFIKKLSLLLNKANVSLKDINNIFFLVGPGGQTGERVSISFVTAMAILNSKKEVFCLDSLTFQAGNNQNCLSVISVGKNTKKYYANFYKNGKKIFKEKEEKKEHSEIIKIKDKYKIDLLLYDFEKLNFIENFFLLKSSFFLFNGEGFY